jgi:acetylornithine deacetylase/succinyl-diaminopimelate desuccinylase-like protein
MARLSLSDADKQARDWFTTTAEGLGCKVSVDEMGNQFAVRPGQSSAAATFAGSHLDTQPSVGFTYVDTATEPDSSSGRPL